ncbi:efflux transporter periplasmic adaptor subunit [Vibrio sp. 10N.286.49.C2]|uniref:efflux RND transporter periplasmic adaptor subunit n=1 Tax=unclassified Vibrio TaxID=2614977 RepID=UPI000C843564|nr:MULTISPECIES: efflux RND transporter periplasmic adaptor subunit [unclassified Vibrio]PMH40658.1 efflux transporter periplasmic adaptor subunit [Vibrio sp. 10N.286.49.C2]PMH45189.1 efflux transporter periplasmic adaptor subunit [Vibrio sp. 10N.286.49.B1]PMH78923.1 efflux transporter periplasmic adaptor subunit [Vibrio sp. 10N.286.48.B7]
MRIYRFTTLLCAALFVFGCDKASIEERHDIPKVKVTEIGKSELKSQLYFPALASAADRSHLSFRVAGEINNITLKEGDFVKKGDILATLEPTDFQLDVDNAQARYAVIDSQYRRSSPLVEKGLLAKSQFDEIAAQRAYARAEFDLAKLRLSFTQLVAPVDGVISRVSAEQFENIQIGQHVVNIHSVEEVEIILQLPDSFSLNQPKDNDIDHIEAIIRVPSGNEYTARLKEFTTQPDPALGTFTATLILPMPKDEYILDGMAVDVTSKAKDIGLKLDMGVSVPIEAVFNQDGDMLDDLDKFVWVLNGDNTVTKQKVLTGKVSRSTIQILEGLDNAQVIVIAGVARLRDGMEVEVLPQEAK